MNKFVAIVSTVCSVVSFILAFGTIWLINNVEMEPQVMESGLTSFPPDWNTVAGSLLAGLVFGAIAIVFFANDSY